jgi:hypothetical protein
MEAERVGCEVELRFHSLYNSDKWSLAPGQMGPRRQDG